MGLFGFVTNIVSTGVKVALIPITVIKDVANIATNEEADATKNLINSAVEDLSDAVEEIKPEI